MGLLGRLFSSKRLTEKPAAKPQPDPNKRGAPRIRLLPLHNVTLIRTDIQPPRRVELVNLSTGGVGFLAKSNPESAVPGVSFRGELSFTDQAFPLSFRTVHVTGAVAGCSFEEPSPELVRMIRRYFEVEFSALTITTVAAEMLQEEPTGAPHWFHGENNCELYFVTRDEEIVSFNLAFFGNFIEGGAEIPTRYGKVVSEGGSEDKPRYKESSLIHWERSVNQDMVDLAIRFLFHVPQLTSQQRETLIRMIRPAGG